MAFKDRISGMFGFGGKGKAPGLPAKDSEAPTDDVADISVPEPATAEERQELIEELGRGFVQVGDVIDRLDQNLSAGTRSLESMQAAQERLPALLAEQQNLIQEVAETAMVSRKALEALTDQLQQRDQVQSALVDRMEQLTRGITDQRETHKQQLDLVMGFHRSSRMLTVLLMIGGFGIIMLLLAALLLMVLRPDTFGLDLRKAVTPAPPAAAPDAHQAPEAPAADDKVGALTPAAAQDAVRIAQLRAAAASPDPEIAKAAKAHLAGLGE